MKILKRSVPLWVVIVSVLAITGVAVAAIVFTWSIDLTMHVKGYGIAVYDTDHVTELTAIDFGNLDAGTTYRFPSSESYFIDNVGDYMVWVSYNITDLPSDVNLTMWIKNQNFGSYDQLQEGEIYSTGTLTEYLMWYIEVAPNYDAIPGDYTPTLVWNAHDTSAG